MQFHFSDPLSLHAKNLSDNLADMVPSDSYIQWNMSERWQEDHKYDDGLPFNTTMFFKNT
jgi:hypothetical protein